MTNSRKLARFRAMTRNVGANTTVALWVCMIASIALLVASFIVPPMGEISPSALKGGSLIFAYATLMEVREAIKEGLGVKLTHGDTSVEVKDLDNKVHPQKDTESIENEESDE